MGNSSSTFNATRRATSTGNLAPLQSENSTARDHGARDRDSSSGCSPRKRNRFSTLRNPFRSRASELGSTPAERSSGAHTERTNRDPPYRRRRMRIPQEPLLSDEAVQSRNRLDPQDDTIGDIQIEDFTNAHSHEPDTPCNFSSTGSAILLDDAETQETRSMDVSGATSNHESQVVGRPVCTDETRRSQSMEETVGSVPVASNSSDLVDQFDGPTAIQGSEPSAGTESSTSSVPITTGVDVMTTESEGDNDAGGVVSQLPGEDQASMLARLLSVAAAATASSLIGHRSQSALRNTHQTRRAMPARTLTDPIRPSEGLESDNEFVDGSFDGFLAALQSGRLAQALRNGDESSDSGTTARPGQEPLNFFRMFRFANATNADSQENPAEPSMIPIIIVGIRSVPVREPGTPLAETVPPFFGTLQNMGPRPERESPFTSSPDLPSQRQAEPALATSRPVTRSASLREARSRDHSNDNSGLDSATVGGQEDLLATSPTDEDGLDAYSRASRPPTSGNGLSGLVDSVMDRFRSSHPESAGQQPQTSSSADSTRRRRRRTAWRPFSTAERRDAEENAANVPDRPSNSSSFLVYVLGGSYPENHPILTTPSLFTDTPTYEDMLLLTSLIGPVRPETAEAQDLDSAGSSFELASDAKELELRCQVCLTDYETGDTCRQLTKCGHLFHKECIDEWLTTGRNNCPLCRTQTGARMESARVPPEDAATSRTSATDMAPLGPVVGLDDAE